ncbi:MAG: NAD(P)-dependent oxidoreductase [Acetatifactor sp.]
MILLSEGMKRDMKIVILERKSVGADVSVDCISDFGEVTAYANTVTMEEIRERVKNADVIIANKAPLREETLKDAPNVKLICEFATGFDNCDLDYCSSRGIKVTNVRDYCTGMVAQHTFALALALSEKLVHYDTYVKSGVYSAQDRFSNFDLPFLELEGKTWGIVGMGHIGRRVAQIAAAMGCRVIFYSVTGKSTCSDYKQVDKDTLLAESDFLSLHCPLSELTEKLIDADALKKMKNTAVLINVARGKVVDNTALYHALVNGEIAGAGLDVVEEEPLKLSNPLSSLKDSTRLIITPHMAWASVEARTRCVWEAHENIAAFLRGEDRNVVNP